jgi:hypothetical protein
MTPDERAWRRRRVLPYPKPFDEGRLSWSCEKFVAVAADCCRHTDKTCNQQCNHADRGPAATALIQKIADGWKNSDAT